MITDYDYLRPAPKSLTATGVDGKDGTEGCLSSDPYPSRPSTPSHLPIKKGRLTCFNTYVPLSQQHPGCL